MDVLRAALKVASMVFLMVDRTAGWWEGIKVASLADEMVEMRAVASDARMAADWVVWLVVQKVDTKAALMAVLLADVRVEMMVGLMVESWELLKVVWRAEWMADKRVGYLVDRKVDKMVDLRALKLAGVMAASLADQMAD